jgi:phage gp29-like protein
MAAPIQKLLKESSTLVEFREGLDAIYPNMDDAKLGEMTTLAMMTGLLDGMDSAAEQ